MREVGSLFLSYRLEFVVEFVLDCYGGGGGPNPQGNLQSACETQP